MGDFLLTLDPGASFVKAAAFLRFGSDARILDLSRPEFSLVVATVDDPHLWGHCESPDLLVSLSGFLALEEAEWQEAEKVHGSGGLAAKWIAAKFRERGVGALTALNGNFSLLVFDKTERKVFLATDPAGAFPLYTLRCSNPCVWSSHPDALALASGEDQNWDETSLAEFAFAGLVTPPHTYYKNIRSIAQGRIVQIALAPEISVTERTYFDLEFAQDPFQSSDDLVEQFCNSFRSAVRKRSLPRLGPTAVALSGGLDSRTILAAIPDRSEVLTFCCFDEENFEFSIARKIARECGVKLVPLPRSFDYYADSAELGLRISGGMGTFANNHFLGVAPQLSELGVKNFLTGCYCDYLFKGLALNLHSTGFLRKEALARYQERFYFSHYRVLPSLENAVRERWRERFPDAIRHQATDHDVFEVEMRRTFPLWHEADNAQRLVPQRLMHSSLPFADRELIELYCRIPYRLKLDRALFKKAASRICGPSLTRIPDANTGAPINASRARELVSSTFLTARRHVRKFRPGLKTESSWPDWNYYVPNSSKLRDLWQKPNPAADDFFRRSLRPEDIRKLPADYKGADLFQFVQLLTLKIWFGQRQQSWL